MRRLGLALLGLFSPQDGGHGPRYVDVAAAVGPFAPNVCGEARKDWILEVNGSGAAWLDADGDGDLDLWLANGSTLAALRAGAPGAGNRLYRNDEGRLTDVTQAAGVAGSRFGCGVAIADVEGDGDLDVLVTEIGPNRLFRNRGDGTFEEVGERAGLADDSWSTSAVFFDADGDGDADLYVANYLAFDLASPKGPGGSCVWKGIPVMCGPEGLPPEADRFYRNEGGRFVEATAEAGLVPRAPGYGLGAVAFDADGDGALDLYVANDSTPNFLFVNRGDGRFAEKGFLSGAALSRDGKEQAGMGVAAGDADGDGREDLLVTNFSGEPNAFYRNLGRGLFADDAFPSGLGGPSVPLLGWGTALLDLDLDGDLDAFVANGHVYPQADGAGTDTSYAQRALVFENVGRGKFRDRTGAWGDAIPVPRVRRAASFGDFDDDGSLEILVGVLGAEPELLDAQGLSGGSLVVRLVGTRSRRDGEGALVRIETGGTTQARRSRRAYSFQSSNDPRVHFGLGAASAADVVEVLWPSGLLERREDVPAGARLLAREGSGLVLEGEPPRARDE